MEALVDEDARQKADAAGLAILSELELDAKKNTRKGGDPVKHPNENSKKKKKKKDKKKAKDLKVCIFTIEVAIMYVYMFYSS